LSDVVRDDIMPSLGVRLEDGSGDGPSVWKLEAAEELKRVREAKKREIAKKALEKLQLLLKKKQAAFENMQEAEKPPASLFPGDQYSQFAPGGWPTHGKDGKELSPKTQKNLQKKYEQHNNAHVVYKEQLAKDPKFIQRLQQELIDLEGQVKAAEAEVE